MRRQPALPIKDSFLQSAHGACQAIAKYPVKFGPPQIWSSANGTLQLQAPTSQRS